MLERELRPGASYRLSRMAPEMWESSHREFGRPTEIAAIYLGARTGARTWHLFEVWVGGRERGCVMMPTADLEAIHIEEI